MNHVALEAVKETTWILCIVIGAAAGGLYLGASRHRLALQQQAIERGYAIHDPITGDWRWKTDSEVAR